MLVRLRDGTSKRGEVIWKRDDGSMLVEFDDGTFVRSYKEEGGMEPQEFSRSAALRASDSGMNLMWHVCKPDACGYDDIEDCRLLVHLRNNDMMHFESLVDTAPEEEFQLLSSRNDRWLTKEQPPDGDCLYHAFAWSLKRADDLRLDDVLSDETFKYKKTPPQRPSVRFHIAEAQHAAEDVEQRPRGASARGRRNPRNHLPVLFFDQATPA